MRLWHEALIPYLPRQQLLGQHRELAALRGNGWGKKHSVVNYVFEHPYEWLVAYHWRVMDEMTRRGYKHDSSWNYAWYRGKSCKPSSDISKRAHLNVGAIEKDFCSKYIYPEHNDAYLKECLENLEAKGIHIDMEK